MLCHLQLQSLNLLRSQSLSLTLGLKLGHLLTLRCCLLEPRLLCLLCLLCLLHLLGLLERLLLLVHLHHLLRDLRVQGRHPGLHYRRSAHA